MTLVLASGNLSTMPSVHSSTGLSESRNDYYEIKTSENLQNELNHEKLSSPTSDGRWSADSLEKLGRRDDELLSSSVAKKDKNVMTKDVSSDSTGKLLFNIYYFNF